MPNRELCHSTSKLIGDEEDTLKSFMKFDVTPYEPVFRVVVGSQIVVPPIMTYTVCPKTNLFSSLEVFVIIKYKNKKIKK